MTGKKAAKMLGQIYKGYIYKNLIKEAAGFVRDNVQDLDLDKRALLRRVGLKPVSPARSFFGGFSLFIAGGVLGAVAGILLAPKAGSETIAEVKDRAMNFVQSQEGVQQPARA